MHAWLHPPSSPHQPAATPSLLAGSSDARAATPAQHTYVSYTIGVAELLAQTTMSALVAIYLEIYLKRDFAALSIWEVNVQLAMWSTLAYALLAVAGLHGLLPGSTGDAAVPPVESIFDGWSPVTVAVAAVQALGGVLVALCLRYTDAVLQNIPAAASAATVSSISGLFLGGPGTLPTAVGALLVSIGVMDYSVASTSTTSSPSVAPASSATTAVSADDAPAAEEAKAPL